LLAAFFLTRRRGERGGKKIGFSPRAPRLRVNLCRGFSFASRIFSHAETRRARREEDWILSACSAAPREPRACLLKRRSVRRSAPRPGSAPPATVAALPRVLVCQSDFFSRGGAESAEEGRLDFLRVSASPREPLPRVLVCLLKRRSVRRSAPRPGSATHGYRRRRNLALRPLAPAFSPPVTTTAPTVQPRILRCWRRLMRCVGGIQAAPSQ
jgi:hypothetical protein